MVSQSVLLKGVNDDADTLEALMRAFVEARVKPYYLHHGDLAPGTAHFRVAVAAGQALMRELRRRLSGLAMPAYVLDIPGGARQGADRAERYVAAAADGTWRRRRPGRASAHRYDDRAGAAYPGTALASASCTAGGGAPKKAGGLSRPPSAP